MELNEDSRVLLVDDFTTSRRMIRQCLKDLGTELCIEAATAEDALRLLPKHKFQLALVDWHLPDSSGAELIQQIRTTHSKKNLTVLLMLMDQLDDQIARGKSAGMNSTIFKPFDAGTLSKTLMGLE
jgi:two-component system chemotaxis response regulator CheY